MTFSSTSLVQNQVTFSGILIFDRIDGIVPYKSSSLVLILEIVKFLMSCILIWPIKEKLLWSNLRGIIQFSIPALCYSVNNNLAVFMQDHMDPATFQVLCNLKIVTTAILYRLIIKRNLKSLQWLSIVLLTLAGIVNSYAGMTFELFNVGKVYLSPTGLLCILFYCFLSGFAGVYTEYILKKDHKISLSLQNCYLYTYGILLNLILWCLQRGENESLLQGFTIYTWILLLCQAISGLIMSVIMKHSNNIVRLFVITTAIPVTTILSMIFFDFQPDLQFYATIVMVIVSIALYTL